MDFEDFYNEGPSDFDIAIEEFKEGLRKTVKEEILNEMARLKKENEELQEVKENFEKIKQEYKDKERQFNIKEGEMMRTLARKKITELTTIADFSEHLYCINSSYAYIPKCDKCDDKREIHFKSPNGKDFREECPICGKGYWKYFVKPLDAIKINFTNDPFIKSKAWAVKYREYTDSTTYQTQDIWRGTADEFDINDNYKTYHTAFDSKELAQQICDRENKKNNVPDNAEIEE